MLFLNLILIYLLNNAVPVAQVQVVDSLVLYSEPTFSSDFQSKARPGEVLLVYAIQGSWAQTERGWFKHDDLTLEPAVVHYSAGVHVPIEIEPILDAPSGSWILPGESIGVAAIFENRALVYTRSAVGWTSLSELEINPPTADLVDFVEQGAYVRVEEAVLFTLPDEQGEKLQSLPLGQEAVLVYQSGTWVLVRSRHRIGWGRSADFEVGLKPIIRAETNASPINFYYPVPNETVIGLLDYRENVLVLGKDESGKWLYLRRQDGTEGWSPAQYFDVETDQLPVVKGN